MTAALIAIIPLLVAFYWPGCVTPAVVRVDTPAPAPLEELWEEPSDLSSRDLFFGEWGPERAPDPNAVYAFVKPKTSGVNPGMTVRDPAGREWKIKQPPANGWQGAEGPVEVTVSRVLSAVGYHQPPVYFLPSFRLLKDGVTTRAIGGRFRLEDPALRDIGEWSWQRNPFVGTRPYQGLLVILLIFNSSDLKNSNNTLYQHLLPDGTTRHWFVVRDLGTALGTTGRLAPYRGNPDAFERHGFIRAVRDGFVEFDYGGFHQELITKRITRGDLRWACEQLDRLSEAQWQEAFRAGGYDTATAGRFIARVQDKIRQGLALGADGGGSGL